MSIDTSSSGPVELRELGNKHFKSEDYKEALKLYTLALTRADKKAEQLPLYKNRAACHLKTKNYQEALKDSTSALNICPSDTKALFRRVQALENLGQLNAAYVDARRLVQMEPKNKMFTAVCGNLRTLMEVKMFEERSTENRVNQMFKILFDSSLEDEDKKKKAAENLVFLSRDEAGAERIFREGGPSALAELADSKSNDVKLAGIRTMSGLCNGHQARSLVILREVGIDRICECIGSLDGNDELSTSAMHLLQSIIDALQGEDKREHRGKENALRADFAKDLLGVMIALQKMLTNIEVSAEGRDNCISLIAKNIPRREQTYGSDVRTVKFLEIGGVTSLMNVASYAHNLKISPFKMTENTRLNCSVALSKLYDDLGGDRARETWNEKTIEYVGSLFGEGNMTSSMRALSVVTCLLQGPHDCGHKVLGIKGVMETMVAMTGAEEEAAQVAAVEAVISSSSKKNRALFVIENGVTLLKQLYKEPNSSDAVRVRALVGLCKLGSSHGTDVSMKSFADGSTVKLAKQCKKYLTNPAKDFDLRKWSAEGLSFLTLDADVKEMICDDANALKALFELSRTKDKTVMYGVVSCLVNITNTYDKGDEITPEMIELAKYAKHHIPEEHEKDKREFITQRVDKLVEAGMIPALVALANTDAAILTDTSKELLCRVFHAAVENEANRGAAVAAGAGRVLLPLAKEGTTKGKRLAAQAIAKLIITQNPVIAFPGQRSLECVKALKELMHPECAGLQNFEALMALTNLAAIDESHRRRMVHAKLTYDIETYMLEEHDLIRRAATETMCNMCMSPDFQEMMAKGGHDRLKILVLLLAEDDEPTRLAASGALGILTSNKEEICKKIRDQTQAWIDNLSMTCLSDNLEIAIRGCVIVHNVVAACKKSAEEIADSNILEILIVHSKSEDEKKKKLKEIALKALKQMENDKFIQSTEREK